MLDFHAVMLGRAFHAVMVSYT